MSTYRFIRDYRAAVKGGDIDAKFVPTCDLCHGEGERCTRCGGRLGDSRKPGEFLNELNANRKAAAKKSTKR